MTQALYAHMNNKRKKISMDWKYGSSSKVPALQP
jgi:hypothetical protein